VPHCSDIGLLPRKEIFPEPVPPKESDSDEEDADETQTDEVARAQQGESFQGRGAFLVAVGSKDGRVRLFNSERNVVVAEYRMHAPGKHVSQVKFSADSSQLFTSGYDGYLKCLDVEYGAVISSFCACACPLSSFCIEDPYDSPDIVFTGSWSGIVQKLDMRMKTATHTTYSDRSVASPIRALACAQPHDDDIKANALDSLGKIYRMKTANHFRPATIFLAHGNGHVINCCNV